MKRHFQLQATGDCTQAQPKQMEGKLSAKVMLSKREAEPRT